jgi:hypothetical protein
MREVIELWQGRGFLAGNYIPSGYVRDDIRGLEDLLPKDAPKEAFNIGYQVHWGDWRKHEKVPYFHHVLCVTLRYAERFGKRYPFDRLGVCSALLHDTVENAYKYINYLSKKIKEYEQIDPGAREPITFFNEHIPPILKGEPLPLFLQFAEKEYGKKYNFTFKKRGGRTHCKRDEPTICKILKKVVEEKDCGEKYAEFVKAEIEKKLFAEIARIVRVLTRETDETRYLAGFERDDLHSNPETAAMMRKIAADIKCLDIIHNLSTLNMDTEAGAQQAARTILRTSDSLDTLRNAGAETDWFLEMCGLLEQQRNLMTERGHTQILVDEADRRERQHIRPLPPEVRASHWQKKGKKKGPHYKNERIKNGPGHTFG